MKRKRFGIDIDGTITRPDTFIPHLNKAFNLTLTYEDVTQYDFYPYVNVSKEKFDQWFRTNEPIFYRESLPVDDAKEVLSKWGKKADLFFISARHQGLHEITHKWFAKHKFDFHHIELIGAHNKVEAVKNHGVEIFFEDKHDNAVAIAEECNIPVILFNTPYNQEPVPNRVIRVQSWREAEKWVNHWWKNNE